MNTRVLALTVVVAVWALAANWAAAQSEPVEIEVGHFSSTSKLIPWFQAEIEAFQAAHPNVRVALKDMNQPARGEMRLEEVPDLAANVIGIDAWSGYEVPYFASRDMIVPIDTFLPDSEFSTSDFYENLFELVRHDGKIWGVPFTAAPLVLVYKPGMFAAAGLSAPPATWDEFRAFAEKLTVDRDGDGEPEQYGFGLIDHGRVSKIVASMAYQLGGTFFNEDGPNFSSPVVQRVLQDWNDIAWSDFTYHPWKGVVAEYAMEIVDHHHFDDRVKQSKDVALAPLPSHGPRVQCGQGSTFFAIRKSSPEQQAASWEFVKWMTRGDATLPSRCHGITCRKDTVDRAELQDMGALWCRNWEMLYRANAEIADGEPKNLVGRQQAFRAFMSTYTSTLMTRSGVTAAIEQGTPEAAKFITKLETPKANPYALFR